jgi:hypothetical protein
VAPPVEIGCCSLGGESPLWVKASHHPSSESRRLAETKVASRDERGGRVCIEPRKLFERRGPYGRSTGELPTRLGERGRFQRAGTQQLPWRYGEPRRRPPGSETRPCRHRLHGNLGEPHRFLSQKARIKPGVAPRGSKPRYQSSPPERPVAPPGRSLVSNKSGGDR